MINTRRALNVMNELNWQYYGHHPENRPLGDPMANVNRDGHPYYAARHSRPPAVDGKILEQVREQEALVAAALGAGTEEMKAIKQMMIQGPNDEQNKGDAGPPLYFNSSASENEASDATGVLCDCESSNAKTSVAFCVSAIFFVPRTDIT